MVDCATLYSCNSGITQDGQGTFTFLRHMSNDAYKDGFNYVSTGLDPSAAAVTRINELDCISDFNGNDNVNDASSNASSAHNRERAVRVNGDHRRTQNRTIHDIEQARSWNLGVRARDCRQTGPQSAAFVSGYDPNTGETTQMWLDGCVPTGHSYDLQAYEGGKVYIANMGAVADHQRLTNDTSTITTYASTPTLPGAISDLAAVVLSSTSIRLDFTPARERTATVIASTAGLPGAICRAIASSAPPRPRLTAASWCKA